MRFCTLVFALLILPSAWGSTLLVKDARGNVLLAYRVAQ